jgi:hypothetical protein
MPGVTATNNQRKYVGVLGNQSSNRPRWVLVVLTQTPASAEYLDGDSGLGGTNCGFLTLQQCRATEILRAGLMLHSARVYGAQPQLTAPSFKPRVCWRFT